MPVPTPAAALMEFVNQNGKGVTEDHPSPTTPMNFPILRATADTTLTSAARGSKAKKPKLGRPKKVDKTKGKMKGKMNGEMNSEMQGEMNGEMNGEENMAGIS
jgi:hypothetical protein